MQRERPGFQLEQGNRKTPRPHSHRTRNATHSATQANGTCCHQWECSPCMQARSKDLHARRVSRPVWIRPKLLTSSSSASHLQLKLPFSLRNQQDLRFCSSNLQGIFKWYLLHRSMPARNTLASRNVHQSVVCLLILWIEKVFPSFTISHCMKRISSGLRWNLSFRDECTWDKRQNIFFLFLKFCVFLLLSNGEGHIKKCEKKEKKPGCKHC